MFSAHTHPHAWEIAQYLHVRQSDIDHAGTSSQCSLSPSPGTGPVSNKSEVWKNEGSVASKVRFEGKIITFIQP